MFLVKQVLQEFCKYITAIRTKVTAATYTLAVDRFLTWFKSQGYSRLESAPRNTLQNYCMYLVNEGYSPATVRLQIVGVIQFLKFCRMFKEIPIPEFYPVELPKTKTKVKDILVPAAFTTYFRLANELTEPTRTALKLLPCSGLRCEELVSLPLNCLRRTTLRLKNGREKQTLTVLVKGKGGNERLVPLLEEGAQALTNYLKGWRSGNQDIKWMFPGKKKQHIASRTIRDALQRIRKPLKMKFTPHTMRRTYLTTLYHQGVDPVILAKIAGHKSTQTLMNHYLYLDEQDLASAVHHSGGRLIT